jgi:hypothetical protein
MKSLVFVYNANSGIFNSLLDTGHKLFSPNTYQCDLCALTFDTFSENKLWKKFREQSKSELKFYHIDEFEKEFPNVKFEYPVILVNSNNQLEEFLSKKDLQTIKSAEALIKTIEVRID